MAQASAVGSGAGSEGASLRVKIQRFGSYLSGMVMPEGERSALARYTGIEEDHPLVDLVVERLDRT
jgi:hypothetical protein